VDFVEAAMIKNEMTAYPEESVADVFEKMTSTNLQYISIVEDGRVTGGVSIQDILKSSNIAPLGKVMVKEIMSRKIVCCSHKTQLTIAVAVMVICDVQHMPVIRRKKIVGLFSRKLRRDAPDQRHSAALHLLS